MINTRYKKLAGVDAGQFYVVAAPYGEIETPMRWVLHKEGSAAETLIVVEDELANTKLWQSLDDPAAR
jgi:uncharacterized protein YueI